MEISLIRNTLEKLAKKIENNLGIKKYIYEDNLAENWFVVEFVEILSKLPGIRFEIEKPTGKKYQHADIICDTCAIEFKVIGSGKKNSRAINWEKSSVKCDVEKLERLTEFKYRIIIVIDYKKNGDIKKDYSKLEEKKQLKFEVIPFLIDPKYQGNILFAYVNQ